MKSYFEQFPNIESFMVLVPDHKYQLSTVTIFGLKYDLVTWILNGKSSIRFRESGLIVCTYGHHLVNIDFETPQKKGEKIQMGRSRNWPIRVWAFFQHITKTWELFQACYFDHVIAKRNQVCAIGNKRDKDIFMSKKLANLLEVLPRNWFEGCLIPHLNINLSQSDSNDKR